MLSKATIKGSSQSHQPFYSREYTHAQIIVS
jgi:hypothetical protein